MIRKFGFEIRKIGNLKSLYSDVDAVLSKYDIEKGGISTFVQSNALAHALHKMLRTESHFSVCTIRDCANMCQICISEERMQVYCAAHCIHWLEMTDDFKKILIAMVFDDFRPILNPDENALAYE